MPYKSLSDLPDSVRDNLPKHAQEIYRAAYNTHRLKGVVLASEHGLKRLNTGYTRSNPGFTILDSVAGGR